LEQGAGVRRRVGRPGTGSRVRAQASWPDAPASHELERLELGGSSQAGANAPCTVLSANTFRRIGPKRATEMCADPALFNL